MNDLNFWQRNEGSIIGTLGAALIAILAAFLTYYLSQRQSSKNKEKAYQGLLYALHVELDWHNSHLGLLENSLAAIEQASISNDVFIIENPPTQFNLLICENTISKMVDYEKFNHEIVALLTSYMNQIRNINYFINFNNANAILSKVENKAEKKLHIKNYFTVLNDEYIHKTRPVISQIRILIEKELKDYPKEIIVNKELNETAHNKGS